MKYICQSWSSPRLLHAISKSSLLIIVLVVPPFVGGLGECLPGIGRREIGRLESGQVFKVIGAVGFPPFLHLFQKGLFGAGLHILALPSYRLTARSTSFSL